MTIQQRFAICCKASLVALLSLVVFVAIARADDPCSSGNVTTVTGADGKTSVIQTVTNADGTTTNKTVDRKSNTLSNGCKDNIGSAFGDNATKNGVDSTSVNAATAKCSNDHYIDGNGNFKLTDKAKAEGQTESNNSCSNASNNANQNNQNNGGDTVNTISMTDDQKKSLNKIIENNWLPAFQAMATQLTASMMNQAFIVGTLFDAKLQLETQSLYQELTAAAHRDYQTDTTMCAIGTNVRSLSAAETLARANTRALDLAMQKREMLSGDQGGSAGIGEDLNNRWDQFKKVYCDPYDAGHNLAAICLPATGRDPARINRDINYTGTVDGRYTLNADFTKSSASADKDDVLALSKNLFAFRTFDRISPESLSQDYSHDLYQDVRSIEAMRGVARNSFAHVVGMRAAGTPAAASVAPFMQALVRQMGVPAAEIDQFLGASPSYFAQEEVLTHMIYENPAFYANLYTTPANVGRIGVSIQALRLMQDRDRYESALRREMLVSMLLENQVRSRQEAVTANFLSNMAGSLMNRLSQ